MVALSWFIFTWLFSAGEIDREADHKTITSRLKNMKKVVADKENQNANYVYEKWTWFGSGFYGLAGLWTFAVIEITQFFGFIFNFPGFEELFGDGIIDFIITFFVNQLGNVIQAFVWFAYWPSDSIIIWILVAYLGYWAGVELARRNVEFPIGDWMKRLDDSPPEEKSSFADLVSQVKEKIETVTADLKRRFVENNEQPANGNESAQSQLKAKQSKSTTEKLTEK